MTFKIQLFQVQREKSIELKSELILHYLTELNLHILTGTVKISNIRTPKKIAVIILKFEKM